ncbi:MAG: hypothetical protein ACJ8EY_05700 [Sphingomicrobium sp.]
MNTDGPSSVLAISLGPNAPFASFLRSLSALNAAGICTYALREDGIDEGIGVELPVYSIDFVRNPRSGALMRCVPRDENVREPHPPQVD